MCRRLVSAFVVSIFHLSMLIYSQKLSLPLAGFMLDMPILTTVGALIGCSGAALTKIMCDAMNRDILSVILGGYGTKSSAGGEAMKFEGEATTTNVDDVCKLLMEAESSELQGVALCIYPTQFLTQRVVFLLLQLLSFLDTGSRLPKVRVFVILKDVVL